MFYGLIDGWDADLAWLAAHGWDAVIGEDDPAFQAAVPVDMSRRFYTSLG
jgi:hypothetical protein